MRLHGSQRKVRSLGNLGLRQTVRERQFENVPLLRAELLHIPLCPGCFFFDLDLLFVPGRRLDQFPLEGSRIELASAPSESVDETAPGDGRDVGCFRRHLRIEPARVAPHFDKNLLDRVFGVCMIRAELSGNRPNQTAVLSETLLDRA